MYVELVCGPPGCGKTTYCEGKRQYLSAFHARDRTPIMVNLDAANEGIFPYPCDIDIGGLVQHAEVMKSENLGPNGTYLFVIEYLAENIDWLLEKLRLAAESVSCISRAPNVTMTGGGTAARYDVKEDDFLPGVDSPASWFIVDCPGQVECYVHSAAMRNIVTALQKELRAQVVMTHLCDGAVMTRDPHTYIAGCLLCLSTMVDLELPHVNLLSKWDTIEQGNTQVGRDKSADEALALPPGWSSSDHEDLEDNESADRCDQHRGEMYLDTQGFLEYGHFDRLWNKETQKKFKYFATTPESQNDDRLSGSDNDQHKGEVVCRRRWADKGRMAKDLLETVCGYGLVGFTPLNVQDCEMMQNATERVDAAAGYIPMRY